MAVRSHPEAFLRLSNSSLAKEFFKGPANRHFYFPDGFIEIERLSLNFSFFHLPWEIRSFLRSVSCLFMPSCDEKEKIRGLSDFKSYN
jgi:hypothetical protein